MSKSKSMRPRCDRCKKNQYNHTGEFGYKHLCDTCYQALLQTEEPVTRKVSKAMCEICNKRITQAVTYGAYDMICVDCYNRLIAEEREEDEEDTDEEELHQPIPKNVGFLLRQINIEGSRLVQRGFKGKYPDLGKLVDVLAAINAANNDIGMEDEDEDDPSG